MRAELRSRVEGELQARHLRNGLLTIHDLEEIALDLAHAVLGGDGATHRGDFARPAAEELFAARELLARARQNVHVQMVVADMAPCGRLKTCLGERRAVERHDVRQALVRHGHVAAELRNRGLRAATLVDEHVHALRHRMAKESQRLAVDGRARHPRRARVAARLFDEPAQALHILHGLFLARRLELHEETAAE